MWASLAAVLGPRYGSAPSHDLPPGLGRLAVGFLRALVRRLGALRREPAWVGVVRSKAGL